MDPEIEEAIGLLKVMFTIRAFEEKVSELFAQGLVPGLIHLGIGQEATAAGVCAALERQDYLYSGHRAHGHSIAKGADLGRLMAEIMGRATGYCQGKGGSMHIVAAEVGMLGATGVVGGNLPLALGTALAAKRAGKNQVVAVFFGDGAVVGGAFHESLNLASVWELPVLFVCENNGYAEFTPQSQYTRIERVSSLASTYGVPSETVDGNDVQAVREAALSAVEKLRSGKGPVFLELLTYRLRGHYEGDPAAYRTATEVEDWRRRDPILRLKQQLLTSDPTITPRLEAVEAEARRVVEEAAAFALRSPEPGPETMKQGVYAHI